MISFFKYAFAVILIYNCDVVLAQNETKMWYFGRYCALDFKTNPPTSVANGTMATWEGCASTSDASGNILFYTNGIKIWNRSHLVMANGTGLLGDNSSSQSALIVKQPGSSTVYFIFTTDGATNGLCYSIVDLTLAAGMGSVTVKNVLLSTSSSERLCGTKHCNGTDVWVISHDNYSDVFRANLVTAGGVSATAVLSGIGTYLSGLNYMGCMKVSPNGKKLGTALYYPASFELYDFNTSTGVVSNSLSLPSNLPGYGCEFSPDGTKFYGSMWGTGSAPNRLCQWNLCAGSDKAIVASASTFSATHTGQLQLAPDGKIYQARATLTKMKMSPEVTVDQMQGEPILGVIHNPNVSAAFVNFNNTGLSVYPKLSMFGLPNFISGFYKTPVAQFSFSINPTVSCIKAFFSSPPLINAACNATSYTVASVKWQFGDPASGSSDVSVLVNPQHTYPDIGKYDVRLILYNYCGGVIDTLKQQVVIGGALINNPSDFSICSGQTLTLAVAGSSNYTWSTGATADNIVVTPSTNTTYSVGYTDQFGCLRKSVQTITVNPLPAINITGKDTLCAGNIFTLTVNGTVSYSWNTGSTNSTINVKPALSTSYSVTGTTFYGCSAVKVFPVIVKPAPLPIIVGNTLICAGSAATVVANGNDTYLWNNGTKGATFTVVPDDEQWIFSVKATYANGCGRTQTVRFIVKPLPHVSVAGITTLCLGATVTQTASGALTYSWSNGITTNPAYLAPLKNTSYTLTGIDSNNCSNHATVLITVKPSSFYDAFVSGGVAICDGSNAILFAGGGNHYDWKPLATPVGVGNSTVMVSPTVSTVFSVTVSNDNLCGITKTVVVLVNPTPKISAGRDTIFNPEDPMFITASGTGTISWIGGDGIACAHCISTQIYPVGKTCYQAQTINEFGCMAMDEVCVDVSKEYAVYIPNTFTPNGDGLNDEFFVSGFGISNVHLTIFDRWGEKLFTSTGGKEAWNGDFRGKPCDTGTYSWFLEYVSTNGKLQQKTGLVNLLQY